MILIFSDFCGIFYTSNLPFPLWLFVFSYFLCETTDDTENHRDDTEIHRGLRISSSE